MRIELAEDITLAFIKDAVGLRYDENDAKIPIKYISTDTRTLQNKDLFIALKGDKYDAEDFLQQAKQLGALTLGKNVRVADIVCRNTEDALMRIANKYKQLISPRHTLAITGSVGKTTTKELCADLLSQRFKVHKTKGNLNNTIGVPLTVLSMPKDTEVLIAEAGMNHRHELAAISECLNPDLSVITCIGTAHIGNLGSRSEIAEAKKEILKYAASDICPIPHGEPLLSSAGTPITVSTESADADFYLNVTKKAENESTLDIYTPDFVLKGIPLRADRPHIPLCMAYAIAVGAVLGMKRTMIEKAIANYNTRFSPTLIRCGKSVIIDDSYNSSPEAAHLALDDLKKYNMHRIAVLGDMLELGEYAEQMHRRLGQKAADAELDYLFAVGDMRDIIAKGAEEAGMDRGRIFTPDISSSETAARLIASYCRNCAILFKASHALHLTELCKKITDILSEE
jgi:UDP-N-acetylmuramoyl-tripeptide--D-alanyl-D-alanine ligase